MPGFLSKYDQVDTVYFDDDKTWWAKVRKYPARSDFKAAQSALLSAEVRYVDQGDGKDATADTRGKVDTGAYQDELVARALIDWNLTDVDGEPIPLGRNDPVTGPDPARRAAVAILPEEPFERILTAIEGGTRRRKSEEAKAEHDQFRKNGSRGASRPEVPAAT